MCLRHYKHLPRGNMRSDKYRSQGVLEELKVGNLQMLVGNSDMFSATDP